jgi:hypothetical protein
VREFPSDVYTTAEYARTVKLTGSKPCADSYQRPIQWILSSNRRQLLVIISPYEAHELMPCLRKSTSTFLHLYAPRPSLSFPSLDELTLYTVPRLEDDWQLPRRLRLLRNLFAGQLYFGSFKDYKETCGSLSLAWKPSEGGVSVEADGFIVRKYDGGEHRFHKSPVKFLMVLLTGIRRDCEGIDKTHWGRIFGGELLTESEFSGREVYRYFGVRRI